MALGATDIGGSSRRRLEGRLEAGSGALGGPLGGPLGGLDGSCGGATQVTPQAGLPSDTLDTTPDGFATSDPVKPGRRELAFSYQLPYDSATLDLLELHLADQTPPWGRPQRWKQVHARYVEALGHEAATIGPPDSKPEYR